MNIMKTLNLIYPMTLALAVTLAGTGCHRGSVKTTQLPDSGAPIPDQVNGTVVSPVPGPSSGVPSGQPIPPDNSGNANNNTPPPLPPPTGPIPTDAPWDPRDPNLIEDRGALAASTVHFAFDSAVLKTGEQSNVQAVAAYLTSNPADKLMIEGNCDERGTEEYNRSLGERRALALREALAALSIDPKRVRTISFGKDKPADPGHDDAAFAKNRRGDFVVYHRKPGV
jgi:peptidoglycan-associated lipoprotein